MKKLKGKKEIKKERMKGRTMKGKRERKKDRNQKRKRER